MKIDLTLSSLVFALNFAVGFSQSSWFSNCDKVEYVFTLVTHFRSKWYSPTGTLKYDSGSSCRFHAIAPAGYILKATCTIELETPKDSVNCPSQRFYVSREGDKALRDSQFWCGTSTFTVESIGSEMTLGYTSQYGLAGKFECSVHAVLVTEANCDCGWSVNVSCNKKNCRIILQNNFFNRKKL